MLSVDPAALGRLNTKSIQEKMEEKAKLLVNIRSWFSEMISDCLHVFSDNDNNNYPLLLSYWTPYMAQIYKAERVLDCVIVKKKF